jgi:hypothetical protein
MAMNEMLRKLYEVAEQVGEDVNNPEGGLTRDTEDDVIIEVVCDIANGAPHKLKLDYDYLTEQQREAVVAHFFIGADKETT